MCGSTCAQGALTVTQLLFFRSPEGSSIKQKMVYSASKDKFVHELGQGLAKHVQANDNGDLEWDYVLSKISEHDRN